MDYMWVQTDEVFGQRLRRHSENGDFVAKILDNHGRQPARSSAFAGVPVFHGRFGV